MIRAMLAALLLAAPAAAQRAGCGYGLGLNGLRAADTALAGLFGARDLLAGREAAGQAAAGLREGVARFTGCGCTRLAELVEDAAGIAESGIAADSVTRLRAVAERARFSIGLAREAAGRTGCR